MSTKSQVVTTPEKEHLVAELAKKLVRGENEDTLLRKVATVQASGTKRFVASEHLAAANVGYTNQAFKDNFLGKVEENVGEAKLAVSQLTENAQDCDIMHELKKRKETKLAHFFDLLKKQSQGQPGDLLVDGSANIAYIIGTDGNFWAVYAYWFSDFRCWRVYASSVGYRFEWRAGSQVLSAILDT